jgi:hypothetical protein
MCDETLVGALTFDMETMGQQLPGGSVELSEAFVEKHLRGIVGEIPKIACPICQKGVMIEIERDMVFSEPIHLGGGISQQKDKVPIGRKIRLECSSCQQASSGKHIFLTVA